MVATAKTRRKPVGRKPQRKGRKDIRLNAAVLRDVFNGKLEATRGGLTKKDLIKLPNGTIVSRKKHNNAKKNFAKCSKLKKWQEIVAETRPANTTKAIPPTGTAWHKKARAAYEKYLIDECGETKASIKAQREKSRKAKIRTLLNKKWLMSCKHTDPKTHLSVTKPSKHDHADWYNRAKTEFQRRIKTYNKNYPGSKIPQSVVTTFLGKHK